MATIATSQPKWQHAPAAAYDRIFYSGMAVAMAATVFIGMPAAVTKVIPSVALIKSKSGYRKWTISSGRFG